MIEKKNRIDKEINVAKVTNVLLHNPLATEREVAEIAWVSNWTAHNTIKEIEQNWAKSEKIEAIATKDISIIEMYQDLSIYTFSKLKKWIEEDPKFQVSIWSLKDLSIIAKESTARYTLFKGKATDENGWMNSILSILNEIQWIENKKN